jgi:hypothetical protein
MIDYSPEGSWWATALNQSSSMGSAAPTLLDWGTLMVTQYNYSSCRTDYTIALN